MARPSAKDALDGYNSSKSMRSPYESDYRMAAAYCLPSEYSSWQTDGRATPTTAAAVRRTVFDSTGARALPKYQAVLERLATPIGSKWSQIVASDPSLMRSWRVKVYFDELTDLLFKYRYAPRAGFRMASTHLYGSLGAYGTGSVFVGKRQPNALSREPGILYRPIKFRDLFLSMNDNGEIDTAYLRFFLNARQYRKKWPTIAPPPAINAEVIKAVPDENRFFEFVHCVHPRDDYDYDPTALSARRHPFVSSYISVEDQQYIGEEEGFRHFPYLTPRVMPQANVPYGNGPAVQVLSNLGSASQMKKTLLKQGNLAVDPVILAHDDGVLNGQIDLRPGKVNYGGMSKDGKKLIDTLQMGNFQVGDVLLASEQNDINDAFMVTLFQMLEEEKEMTATEVVERVAQRGALVSPTMGVLQTEFIDPDIEREIDVLDEIGRLPEMPPELVEARGQYEVQYTSPLAKGMYAEEISGFMRSVQFSIQMAEATGDPSVLDNFDLDEAVPEISDRMAVPPRWLNSPDKKQSIRDQRAKQQAASEATQNAAGLAAAAQTAVSIKQPGVIPGA